MTHSLNDATGSASAVRYPNETQENELTVRSNTATPVGRAPPARHSLSTTGFPPGTIAAQALKYEKLREADPGIIAIDPLQIRLSHFKNRSSRSLTDNDPRFVETRESIRAHGQDTPIWVYQLAAEAAPFHYELVAGRRRHAACMALGIPVLALIKTISSAMDFALLMYRENADRQDLSPVEYGRMFQDWLDKRIFSSQKEIGAKIKRDNSVIARYIRLARLPEVVLAAFEDDREIKLRWCDPLTDAVSKRPDAVFKIAGELKNRQRRKAIEVFEALVNPTNENPGRGTARRSHTLRQESIRIGGRVPLKIGYAKNKVVLQTQHLNEDQERSFVRTVAEYAERSVRELFEPDSCRDRDK